MTTANQTTTSLARIALAILFLDFTAVAVLSANMDIDIESVLQRNEAQNESVRLTWNSDWYCPTDGFILPDGTKAIEKDFRGRQKLMLALDGDRLRFEIVGDNIPMPALGISKPTPIDKVEGLVPGENRFYFQTGPHPHGEIHESAAIDSMDYSGNRAVRFILRPLSTHKQLIKDGYVFSKRTEEGDDAAAYLILEYRAANGATRTLWLDPRLDYAVVKGTRTAKGTVSEKFRVSHHEPGVDGQAILKGWDIELTFRGQKLPFLTIKCSSVESREHAPVFSEDYFRPAFPTGTWVVDHRTGENYIQREDGQRRDITEEELSRGIGYQRLLNTETGEGITGP